MAKLSKGDKAALELMILENKPVSEIALKYGITKGRVSQIKSEMEAEAEKRTPAGNAELIEYRDHAVLDNPTKLHDPPIMAAIGFVIKENNETVYLKQIWSKTTGEHIRYNIILKPNIVSRKPYVVKT